jgi:hypothetical protein
MTGQNQRQLKNRLSETVAAGGTRTLEFRQCSEAQKGVRSGLSMAANAAHQSNWAEPGLSDKVFDIYNGSALLLAGQFIFSEGEPSTHPA